MKEEDWLNRVVGLAQVYGWQYWHVAAPMRHSGRHGGFVPDSRGAGLPDLILIHPDPPRMILAELKGNGGKVSDKQRAFLTAAREVAELTIDATDTQPSVGVYCWFPEDEPIVEEILRSRVLA